MQGKLHEAFKNMLTKDTGTNIHRIYPECPYKDISGAWTITKRLSHGLIKGRKLKITEIKENRFCVEIHRPTPSNPKINILN